MSLIRQLTHPDWYTKPQDSMWDNVLFLSKLWI